MIGIDWMNGIRLGINERQSRNCIQEKGFLGSKSKLIPGCGVIKECMRNHKNKLQKLDDALVG